MHAFIKESNDISGESLASIIRIKNFIKFDIFFNTKEGFIFILIFNFDFEAFKLLLKLNVGGFNKNYKN